MAWIESHQSLRQHPKLMKAARYLGITKAQMIGHLHCLWWWALDYAPDGDLSAYDSSDLAAAADWEGTPDEFLHALADVARIKDKAGFLEYEDDRLIIHDWWEYAGKLVDKRVRDAERKRNSRRKDVTPSNADVTTLRDGRNVDIQRMSSGHPADVAGTNQPTNQQNQPTMPDDDGAAPLDPEYARVSEAYHKNIGLLSPKIAENLKADLADYGADWVVDAIGIATKAEKRNLSYVEGILRRWRTEGKSNGRNGKDADPYKGAKQI